MTDQPMTNMHELLALGTPAAVADLMGRRGTDWASSRGLEAQVACVVLATGQLEQTVTRLDDAAATLQRWALGLAWSSLAISVTALVVAIIK